MNINISEWSILCESEEQRQIRSRSRKLYKKDIITKNLPFRTKKHKLSRLLNEQNIGTVKTIHKDIIIKLDDKNNLKNLIVENERDLNFIDEGLIKTIPTRKLIDLFKNFVKNNLDERLYDLKLSDVQDDTNDNRRLTDIILQSDEKQTISPFVSFYIPIYSNAKKKIIDDLTDYLYVSGYNLYSIDTVDQENVKQPFYDVKIEILSMTFEAKFTEYTVELNDFLYHVVPERYIEKVRKNGLVPSSKSDMFNYPDRVYLFNCYSIEDIMRYGVLKSNKMISSKYVKDGGFFILKISKDEIQKSRMFKDGKLKFYVDPAFTDENNENSIAIFTYENIPLKCICNEMIFVEVKNGMILDKRKEVFKK